MCTCRDGRHNIWFCISLKIYGISSEENMRWKYHHVSTVMFYMQCNKARKSNLKVEVKSIIRSYPRKIFASQSFDETLNFHYVRLFVSFFSLISKHVHWACMPVCSHFLNILFFFSIKRQNNLKKCLNYLEKARKTSC